MRAARLATLRDELAHEEITEAGFDRRLHQLLAMDGLVPRPSRSTVTPASTATAAANREGDTGTTMSDDIDSHGGEDAVRVESPLLGAGDDIEWDDEDRTVGDTRVQTAACLQDRDVLTAVREAAATALAQHAAVHDVDGVVDAIVEQLQLRVGSSSARVDGGAGEEAAVGVDDGEQDTDSKADTNAGGGGWWWNA